MSVSQTTSYNSWLRFEVKLRIAVERTNSLDCHTSESAACALILLALSTTDLLPNSRYTEQDLQHWLLQLAEVRLSSVHALYKACASFLRSYDLDERSTPLSLRSFKHYVLQGTTLRADVFAPIQSEIRDYLTDGNPISLSRCLTFFEFFSRIPLRDESLEEVAIHRYLANESDIQESFDEHLLSLLREEIIDAVGDFRVVEGLPVDFSGNASSEVRSQSGVLKRMAYTCLPIGKHRRLAIKLDLLDQFKGDKPPATSAKFATVPKNISTRRNISMEPVAAMALQKYILAQLDPYLAACKWKITLHQQERNADLAGLGSRNRKYGTIDLSDASDLVSNELVKQVFRGTELYYYTQYTRTPSVTGPFGKLQLKKFAPMGSALCFPIQCIIFAGIVAVANRLKGVHTKFLVYGDDIVCHDRVFTTVLYLLRSFGFRVNADKTFFPYHPFKESCGGEYLNGTRLSIFRLSRQFNACITEMYTSPQVLASAVETANGLFQHGLVVSSRYLVRRILSVDRFVPFTRHSNQYGILCHADSQVNWHLPVDARATQDYQSTYVTSSALISRHRRSRSDPSYAVYAWLQQAQLAKRDRVELPIDSVAGNLYPSVTSRVTKPIQQDR